MRPGAAASDDGGQRLHRHRIAGADFSTFVLEHDEAVGIGHRAQHAESSPSSNFGILDRVNEIVDTTADIALNLTVGCLL